MITPTWVTSVDWPWPDANAVSSRGWPVRPPPRLAVVNLSVLPLKKVRYTNDKHFMEAAEQRIAELAENGVFGPGRFHRVKKTLDDEKGAQFMSQLFFLCVEMETDGKITDIPLVIKIQIAEGREEMGTDSQFVNEVNFYSKVLVEFGPQGLRMCPKMYYGLATAGRDYDSDLVVLEDIRPTGFKLCKELFLDYDHIVLSMRKIGEFHGLSYKLKKSPGRLEDCVKELVSDPKFDYDNGMLTGGMLRGFRPVIKDHPNDEILKRAYEKMSTGSLSKQWSDHRRPEEPFAVIVHGDFNKNNLMYRYDDASGKVNDMKIFDFGTTMYSDPAIDIAFFLYINTNAESREKHWDEYLQAYWEGVVAVEKDPGFNFEQFLKQFAKRAVWGYFPCCFYLPMLMFPDEMPDDFTTTTFDEMKEVCMKWGGEEAEKAVVDVLRHLYKQGYLKEYVENFNL